MNTVVKQKSTPASKSTSKTVAKQVPTKNGSAASVPTKAAVKKPIAPKSPSKPTLSAAKKSTPMSSPAPKATAAEVASPTEKTLKTKKIKLVRDSFTIPKSELAVLTDLKARALNLRYDVKKSELLRAGIKALAAMTDTNFMTAIQLVPSLKTGRPKH